MGQEGSSLKKTLGLFEITAYGVGVIVGAGIYALIGTIAGTSGNMIWLAFVISSFLAVFTGLSYAELASMFPKNSAEYLYIESSTGNKYLGFITTWFVLAMLIITASTVAIGFGNYTSALLFKDNWDFGIHFVTLPVFFALIAILIFTFMNYMGIKLSSRFNIPATLLEVFGLLVIVIGVGYLMYKGDLSIPDYTETVNGFGGLMHGAIIAFFAFTGFGSIAKMSEEVKNAERNIPLAILISIAITTILYVLVALASVAAIPWQELGVNPEPIAAIAGEIDPSFRVALSVIALFSTGNTILISLISSSRMLYGVAVESVLPTVLAKVHPKRRSPHYSIIVTGILAGVLVFIEDLKTIAEVSNLWIFIVYFFVNLSLLAFRYKKKDGSGQNTSFRTPLYLGKIPIHSAIGCIFSVGMIVYLLSVIPPYHPGIWLTLILLLSSTTYYFIAKRRLAVGD